jgi:hypothetical protein
MDYVGQPAGWIMDEEELPRRVRQTIGETKSMLTVVFHPKKFAVVDLLPQDTFFTAVYFLNKVILPLAGQHAQQLGDNGRRKLHLYIDNSNCHTARHVQEQMTIHRRVSVPHHPYSPTWPSQISTCLAGQSNQSPGGPWTVERRCSK